MSGPRFSVVLPTRDRARTLAHALRTCLAQTFQDFEVVVCDNAGAPATRAVVDAAPDPRVRYVRSDVPLSMNASWELGLSHARGEWVMVIGDDDGLMPYALAELDRLAKAHPVQAIGWNVALYLWPDVKYVADRNLLVLPLSQVVQRYHSHARIRALIPGLDSCAVLPVIYHGMFHRDLIARARERLGGRLFLGGFPDLSTFSLAYLAGEYAWSTLPMSVTGMSASSTCVAYLVDKEGDAQLEEFQTLSDGPQFERHPWVCPLKVIPAILADSFLQAKERLFHDDDSLKVEREQVVTAILREVLRLPEAPKREASVRLLREHLAGDRPDLLGWFDAELERLRARPIPPPLTFRPTASGFTGHELVLDAAEFGVADVAGAVALCARLLRIPPEGARYDIQPRGVVAQHYESLCADLAGRLADLAGRLEQAEGRAAAIERAYAGSLSWRLTDPLRRVASGLSRLRP